MYIKFPNFTKNIFKIDFFFNIILLKISISINISRVNIHNIYINNLYRLIYNLVNLKNFFMKIFVKILVTMYK